MKNHIEKKYTYLIIAIIAVFFLDPILDKFLENFPSAPLLITIVIVTFLYVLGVKKRIILLNAGTGIVALGVDIYARMIMGLHPENLPKPVAVPLFILAILFYITAIVGILGKVFSEKKITTDTIWGGVVGYFLMGILWGIIYSLILILNPGAFSQPVAALASLKLMYFSFITLTTLGYGDITPVSHAAMVFTVLEAVAGQIYMAVFVARLIGLELTARTSDPK